mgnify:CR=1 FL=1
MAIAAGAARVTNVYAERHDGASSSSKNNWTYKAGFNWQTTDWLRFRGTYGTSYRAPALFEQFLADVRRRERRNFVHAAAMDDERMPDAELGDHDRHPGVVVAQRLRGLALGRAHEHGHGQQVLVLIADLDAAGLVDVLVVLDSQRRALDARSRYLAVQRQLLANRVDLHLALGGGFGSPVQEPGTLARGARPGLLDAPPSGGGEAGGSRRIPSAGRAPRAAVGEGNLESP